MIEDVVLNYLGTVLDVPVSAQLPTPVPDRFVVVYKSGSARKDGIASANIITEAYAPSRYQAALLNDQVKAAMDALPDLPEISRCQLSTDYPFPDTARKRDRYQAVYSITYYQ